MGLFKRKAAETAPNKKSPSTPGESTPNESAAASLAPAAAEEALKEQPTTLLAILLGSISSLGGLMFGYGSGQISGASSASVHNR